MFSCSGCRLLFRDVAGFRLVFLQMVLSCSRFRRVAVSRLWRGVAVEFYGLPSRGIAVCRPVSLQRLFNCSACNLLSHDVAGFRLVFLQMALSRSRFRRVVVSWLWRGVAVEFCGLPFRGVAVCCLVSLQRLFSRSDCSPLPRDVASFRLVVVQMVLSCSRFRCVVVSWLWRSAAVEFCGLPSRGVAVCHLVSLQRLFYCSDCSLLSRDVTGFRLMLQMVLSCSRFRRVAVSWLGRGVAVEFYGLPSRGIAVCCLVSLQRLFSCSDCSLLSRDVAGIRLGFLQMVLSCSRFRRVVVSWLWRSVAVEFCG